MDLFDCGNLDQMHLVLMLYILHITLYILHSRQRIKKEGTRPRFCQIVGIWRRIHFLSLFGLVCRVHGNCGGESRKLENIVCRDCEVWMSRGCEFRYARSGVLQLADTAPKSNLPFIDVDVILRKIK